jgi:hypothetical protein
MPRPPSDTSTQTPPPSIDFARTQAQLARRRQPFHRIAAVEHEIGSNLLQQTRSPSTRGRMPDNSSCTSDAAMQQVAAHQVQHIEHHVVHGEGNVFECVPCEAICGAAE